MSTVRWSLECPRFPVPSCAGYDEAFTASVHREGSQRETFIQERELFDFFVTDCSAIVSLFYALFSTGAMLNRKRFPIATPKDMRAST